ncbi:MAG: ELWxxDGT repeat protein [Chitinophagaceae bacterium]
MKRLILFYLLLCFYAAPAQQFSLIKDINPGSASSNICYLTTVNNTLFFAANDGVNGMELWKSDGTSAGTLLVKDIYPGIANSSIGYLTNVNSTLFFVANSGTNGTELWKSDGTAAGTIMVKDIRTGGMGSNPSNLVNVNGILFFAADDGINGTELWKSDGTAAGTVLVKNINAGSASGYPQSLANVNGVLFFSADNGTNGTELWKSNGTAAGTVMVKDIWSGANESYPSNLTAIGAKLFFSAGNGINGFELWKSDGTSAGTVQVKDILTGAGDGSPYGLVNVGGELFFSADNGINGIEPWKSDGTTAGTVLVKDVWPGQESGVAGNFSKLLNKLVFTGNDGVNGNKTWESDGTSSGTEMAAGIADTGDGDLQELAETGNNIFASIRQTSIGTELWGINFSSVLPVRLLEFNGRLVKEDAVLNWKTDNENNAAGFVIERSFDGLTYDKAGYVAAANTSGLHSYNFIDAGVTLLGRKDIYYRLKQTDIDGHSTYSNVILLSIKDTRTLRLYPNPANDVINVEVNLTPGALNYQLYDNNGRIVHRYTRQVSAGSNSFPIDISKLAAGVYYLSLHHSDLSKTLQFVKR